MIVLDGDGRVVEISPGAARWAGVAAWQVRGREVVRDLGWLFGAAASARIADFVRSTAHAMIIRAPGRRGGCEADVVLQRRPSVDDTAAGAGCYSASA